MRVVEAGPGNDPTVVLVPGWGCGAWIFHDALPSLAACGLRAIAVELKGHGFSDKPLSAGEYSVESMRDHLIDVLDSLDLERAGLIGHSMGAAIAAQVAHVAPQRVSAMALVAPVGFAGVKGMGLFRFLTPAFALSVFPILASRLLIRGLLAVIYGSLRRASAEDIEEFYAPTQTPGATTALRHLLHEFDWKKPFPKPTVPCMTIIGSEDILSPESDLARFTGNDRISRSLVIEGAGHVIFDEAPDLVNAALCEFFTVDAAPYISSR